MPLATEDAPPAANDETVADPASAETPVSIAEMQLEHSSDHRASLGGLGPDSTWGDSRPAVATASRCVFFSRLNTS